MHGRTDDQGRPLGFILTGGEVSDYNAVPDLLAKPKLFLADKGYDSDVIREELLSTASCQSSRQKRTVKTRLPGHFNAYKDRNRIERMFNRLKQFRRIATRYDKTRLSFAAFLAIAAVIMWLPSFISQA
ncbi:IS5 family transposase [Mesorhizobium sp. dw_380]|uniref:IS5 family transposase n=1 Tax=Mesorhizobium sp. dw_380 TaxID=2812001 RepID=UPI003323CEF7